MLTYIRRQVCHQRLEGVFALSALIVQSAFAALACVRISESRSNLFFLLFLRVCIPGLVYVVADRSMSLLRSQFKFCFTGQHRPGDSGNFVGQSDTGLIDASSLNKVANPLFEMSCAEQRTTSGM